VHSIIVIALVEKCHSSDCEQVTRYTEVTPERAKRGGLLIWV